MNFARSLSGFVFIYFGVVLVSADAAQRYIYFSPSPQAAALPHQTPDELLKTYAHELGFDDVTSELQKEEEFVTLAGRRAKYRQVMNGIPVYRADVLVLISHQGQPLEIVNQAMVPRPLLAATRNDIGETNARNIAVSFVQSGAASRAVFTTDKMGKPISPKQHWWNGLLVEPVVVREIFASAQTAWLCYRTTVVPSDLSGDYYVWVSASTGEVVSVENRMAFHQRGRGVVFDPDPRSALRRDDLKDGNDTDSLLFQSAEKEMPLLDLDPADSSTGLFRLRGLFSRSIEFGTPERPLATATNPTEFRYHRNDPRFEEVNTYYHIDRSQRYIESLGFDGKNAPGIQMRAIPFDAHATEDDNSFYLPSTDSLGFGEGGVDDAEDPDVILHEYGHAIQQSVNKDWGGKDERAMGEGFGDYWAMSSNRYRSPDFHNNWVFVWDGHNEFWPGRVGDGVVQGKFLHYPEDARGEIHDAGMVWSATLWDLMIGLADKVVVDRLVLEHHFSLGGNATMEDAARALVVADQGLYGGTHISTMTPILKRRGFLTSP